MTLSIDTPNYPCKPALMAASERFESGRLERIIVLRSKDLVLKPPSQEDYEALHKIRPCDEYYRMIGENPVASKFLDDGKFAQSFSRSLKRENYWLVFRDAEVIGDAFLHSIDIIDKRARYAVGIYSEAHWNRGYGQQITQTILKYAFHCLKLHRVDLRVLAYNKRAIAVYEDNGFVQEGILRENAFINNEWNDDIVMSILSHEFQSG